MLDIAGKLKKFRSNSGKTAKEVIKELGEYDINIATKTLYGYENGNNNTPANTLMALCSIYGVDNLLDEFGYNIEKNEHDSTQTNLEKELVEEIISLSPEERKAVNTFIEYLKRN